MWFAEARRLFSYAFFGGLGVATDVALFATLTRGLGIDYQVANAAGYAAGTCVSFLLNRRYTFGTLDRPWRRFASFLTVAASGYLVSAALLWLLVERARMDSLVAKLATLVVVLALQYSLNRFVTFRAATSKADA